MPSVIERPAMSSTMRRKLKTYIMRERQRKKEEEAHHSALEQQRMEREKKKKEDFVTLEQTQQQICETERRLAALNQEKHQLFAELKKVLNKDTTIPREAAEAKKTFVTTFVSFVPNVTSGLSTVGSPGIAPASVKPPDSPNASQTPPRSFHPSSGDSQFASPKHVIAPFARAPYQSPIGLAVTPPSVPHQMVASNTPVYQPLLHHGHITAPHGFPSVPIPGPSESMKTAKVNATSFSPLPVPVLPVSRQGGITSGYPIVHQSKQVLYGPPRSSTQYHHSSGHPRFF